MTDCEGQTLGYVVAHDDSNALILPGKRNKHSIDRARRTATLDLSRNRPVAGTRKKTSLSKKAQKKSDAVAKRKARKINVGFCQGYFWAGAGLYDSKNFETFGRRRRRYVRPPVFWFLFHPSPSRCLQHIQKLLKSVHYCEIPGGLTLFYKADYGIFVNFSK
ncbi:MAG: hypothetical protein GY757_10940 [bacterium]|nr:hypothetical protein [bacterium]